jgi:hypothetical protein
MVPKIDTEKLQAIHTRVYRKHGYPTLELGLKAFIRGRNWSKRHPGNRRPPAGIVDKLRMWAEINSAVQSELIRQKEELKNYEAKQKAENDGTSRDVIKVSPES